MFLGHYPELVVGAGRAGLVAETLVDLQGLAVPALRSLPVPPLLGDHPELVVGRRLALLVPKPPPDLGQPGVPVRGLSEAADVLGEGAQRLQQGGLVKVHPEPLGFRKSTLEAGAVDLEGSPLLVER